MVEEQNTVLITYIIFVCLFFVLFVNLLAITLTFLPIIWKSCRVCWARVNVGVTVLRLCKTICKQIALWTFYFSCNLHIFGSVLRCVQYQHVSLYLYCFRFHPNLILGGTYSGQIVLWDNRVQKRTPVQRTPLSTAAHTVIASYPVPYCG